MTSTAADGLPALEARIARDLEITAYPKRDWVAPIAAPDGTAALDCAIVGGGPNDSGSAAYQHVFYRLRYAGTILFSIDITAAEEAAP